MQMLRTRHLQGPVRRQRGNGGWSARATFRCQANDGSGPKPGMRAKLSEALKSAFGSGIPIPSKGSPLTPLADLPMERLKLPKGAFGSDYVLVKVSLKDRGPYEFMVDSGLTGELISPHLQQELCLQQTNKEAVLGLGAGGAVSGVNLVDLKGAALGEPGSKLLRLPSLHAVVAPFPQEHLDPEHDPVEGMIGMEVLGLFDVDLDFPAGRLRLFVPGEGTAAAAEAGMVQVPAAVLNETGIIGIRVTSPAVTTASSNSGYQPFVGILDCGSSFSAVNWAAAKLMGLPPAGDDLIYGSGPLVFSLGVDGRPVPLPTTKVQLTFAGDAHKGREGLRFDPPPREWTPWEPVDVAVGDLPVFSQLLGDGSGKPFWGPAALVGLDILSQRRVLLGAPQTKGRRRPLYVGAS